MDIWSEAYLSRQIPDQVGDDKKRCRGGRHPGHVVTKRPGFSVIYDVDPVSGAVLLRLHFDKVQRERRKV